MQHLKSKKKRTLSSRRWLVRQVNDPYVHRARVDGYRSRAAYKLIQIQNKFNIFTPSSTVMDLGAAPGSWMQVARRHTKGVVIGMDIHDIEPIDDTTTIKGDFLTQSGLCVEYIPPSGVHVILSDMAAATCGIEQVDHVRIMVLLEAVIDFAEQHISVGGTLVGKVFQGGTEHMLLRRLKQHFTKVSHFKPRASRPHSKEMYVVAQGFRSVSVCSRQ